MNIYSFGNISKNERKLAFKNQETHKIIEKMSYEARVKKVLSSFSAWDTHNFQFDLYFSLDENLQERKVVDLTHEKIEIDLEELNVMPDVFALTSGQDIIVSEKVKVFIEKYMRGNSLFFPIKVFKTKYYYWFIKPSDEYLNLKDSEIEWHNRVDYYALEVRKCVFERNLVENLDYFRLPFVGQILDRYFLSESFVNDLINQEFFLSVDIITQSNVLVNN
jgi:hypothetical protein